MRGPPAHQQPGPVHRGAGGEEGRQPAQDSAGHVQPAAGEQTAAGHKLSYGTKGRKLWRIDL